MRTSVACQSLALPWPSIQTNGDTRMFSIKFGRWSVFYVSFFGSINCCLSVCRLGIDSEHFVIDILYWSHATWPILLFSTSYVSCDAFVMLLDFDFFCKSAGSFMYFLWWYCTITDECMCNTRSVNTAESSMYFLWQYCRIIDVLAAQILLDQWCTRSAKNAKSPMYLQYKYCRITNVPIESANWSSCFWV